METNHVYEVIVTPEGGSTGQNLIKIMTCLDVPSRLAAVVVADVECNQERSWVGRAPFATTTEKTIEYARRVGQFDWATFFFFHRAPAPNYDYDQLFDTAEMVIRAVDDTYFYIYSPSAEDAAQLRDCFPAQIERKPRRAVVHPS